VDDEVDVKDRSTNRAKNRATRGLALAMPLLLWSVAACGGRATEPGPDVPSKPRADDSGARASAVGDTFKKFVYTQCASKEDCPSVFARAAGQDASGRAWNPRAHMDAPDPAWLVEWYRLPSGEDNARYVYAALALGAVRRSWAEHCDQAYGAYRKDLDARLGELEPKLARLSIEPNPYDRIGGVLALEPDKPKKGDALGEFVKGSDPVRYAYEAALYDAFNDTNRTFVYAFDGYAPSDALVETMKPRQARDYERDAFCLDAARGAIPGVDPLPDTSSWDGEVREMVRSAIPTPQKAAVEARRSQLVLQVRAKFKNAMTRTPSLPTGIREISVGTVTAFERNGRAARVTVTQTREDRKTVDGISRLQKIDEISTVDFKDWPSGVILDPGDSVSFYGAELTVKDTIIKSTPELEHLSRQRTVDGRHVTKTVTKSGGTKVFFR
jgi:hypothetical protein